MAALWVVWLVCGWFGCLWVIWVVWLACGWFVGGLDGLRVVWLVCGWFG